jgi:uncharacterized DUF497 family protein
MEIEYDPGKNALNLRKHGRSLELARAADWDRALTQVDTRRPYGESRLIASVPVDGVLHMIVFTEREDRMRVISVRRANQRERRLYVEQIEREVSDC